MKLLNIAVAAALLIAPGLTHAAGMETRLGDLVITGAWTRATVRKSPIGTAYVTIENKGTADDRLIAVRSPISETAQIHTTLMDHGIMILRQLINGIEIPAGASVTLKPGGEHLMFIGLRHPIRRGETVPVTLVFAKAGEITLDMTAAPVGSLKPPAMTRMH